MDMLMDITCPRASQSLLKPVMFPHNRMYKLLFFRRGRGFRDILAAAAPTVDGAGSTGQHKSGQKTSRSESFSITDTVNRTEYSEFHEMFLRMVHTISKKRFKGC